MTDSIIKSELWGENGFDLSCFLEAMTSRGPHCSPTCKPLTGLLARLVCHRGHRLGMPYVWGATGQEVPA